MKRAVEAASGSGLKRTEGDNIRHLDFADDIVLIDETAEQLQKLTNSVNHLRKRNCEEDKMYEDRSTGSYVAIESLRTVGRVCR